MKDLNPSADISEEKCAHIIGGNVIYTAKLLGGWFGNAY